MDSIAIVPIKVRDVKPIAPTEIRHQLTEAGIAEADDLVEFFARFNGGTLYPDGTIAGEVVTNLLTLEEAVRLYTEFSLPAFPFANDCFGNYFAYDFDSREVWFLDHEEGYDVEGTFEMGLSDFMESLVGEIELRESIPLFILIESGRLAETLSSQELDTRDEAGRTPLMVACHYSQVEIASALLQAGHDPNAVDGMGRTALFYALNTFCKELIEVLLLHPFDLNHQDIEGQTPLHFHTQSLNVDVSVLSRLVERGADKSIVDHAGKRAVDYAQFPVYRDVLSD